MSRGDRARPGAAEDGFVDAYAVLGVGPEATQDELRAAHRALVRRHHPDLVPPDQRPEATRRVQEINVAYGLVREPAARERYDEVWHLRHAAALTAQASRALGEVDRSAAARYERLLRRAGQWAARVRSGTAGSGTTGDR